MIGRLKYAQVKCSSKSSKYDKDNLLPGTGGGGGLGGPSGGKRTDKKSNEKGTIAKIGRPHHIK